MRALIGFDRQVAEWAAEQVSLDDGFAEPLVSALGFLSKDGTLIGAAVFHAYTGPDVELTVVGRGAVGRDAFKVISHHAFVGLECVRMTAMVRADNRKSLRLNEWAGFKREGVARRKFGDQDCVMFGMLKEECPWL